jgi:hypothetical protein
LLSDPALLALLRRAEAGGTETMPALRQALDEHPEIWQEAGNLALNAERSLIRLAAGESLLLRETIPRQLARFKEQLAEPDDTPLHGLLIERISLGWLEVNYVDALAAQFRERFGAPAQIEAIERRRDHAQRRYLAAVRSLASVRKLLRRGPSPWEIASRLDAKEQGKEPAAKAPRPAAPVAPGNRRLCPGSAACVCN